MSIRADRVHRNLKRVQRYCEKCGHRMRRAIDFQKAKYDGRTGKSVVKYVWTCTLGVPRGHDRWGVQPPKR